MKLFKGSIILKIFLIGFGVILAPLSANAREDVVQNFAGLDGMTTRCIISTKRKYARRMCEILVENAENFARTSNVALAHKGTKFTGEGEDKLQQMQAREVAEPGNSNTKLLNVEFFIRGTEGRTVGAVVRIVAFVDYDRAMEKPDNERANPSYPRSGRLVLWEEEAVASGPANRIGGALAAHMAKKLKLLIELFAQRKTR